MTFLHYTNSWFAKTFCNIPIVHCDSFCHLGLIRGCRWHRHFRRSTVIFYFSLFLFDVEFRMLWHHFNQQINAVNCDRVYFVDWTNSCDNEGKDELWTFVLLSNTRVLLSRGCVFGTSSSERLLPLSRVFFFSKEGKKEDKRQIDGGVLDLLSPSSSPLPSRRSSLLHVQK